VNIIGYQIDLARGQRGDVDYLRKWISRLAEYGYNYVMLYLEYRFKFPSHPTLAAPDSLTPEGVRELDAFSRKLGVELVPQFNCCCHNEGVGALEGYKHLTGDPTALGYGACESLNPLNEATFEFLQGIFGDLAASFSSKYLHIGGDEIRQMHVFMPGASEEDRALVMREFLARVIGMVQAMGRTPMVWGDMLVRYPQVLERVPKNVVVMDWHYVATTKLDSLRLLKNAGYKVIMCPGTNTWVGHPARLLTSHGNAGLTREAREEGAEGICLCTWQNNAGACDDFGWPAILLNAEVARGNDRILETLWEDYPTGEWGVEGARFGEYLDIVERRIPAIFSRVEASAKLPYPFFYIRNQVMRRHNILPMLSGVVRTRFPKDCRDAARPLAVQALQIAQSFAARAARRREEPALWVGATRLMLTMLDMGDEVERLGEVYHEAALCQGGGAAGFAAAMEKVYASLARMVELVAPFRAWAKMLVARHNQSEQERWWPARAQQDLQERSCELKKLIHAGYPLLTFDRFISDLPGVPTRCMWR
jgi:hypothetical protein